MTLTEFLLARIAEDEVDARVAEEQMGGAVWTHREQGTIGNVTSEGGMIDLYDGGGDHIARWDPARVLDECAVKRKIIEEHGVYGTSIHPEELCCTTCGGAGGEGADWPCTTLRALTATYASHPEYDWDWQVQH